ncbi:MAG: tetratricopeptide repeat protein [Devosia sp.]
MTVAVPAHAASNVEPQLTGPQLADIEAQRKALFQKMLAEPSNVDLALQYAELSSQTGDLEGAISALERLLIFAPQVARLNYELGVLYMRLGAYEQASTDFKAALASPDVTDDIKTNAGKYIAIADQQVKGDYLIGTATAGVRYQTNANGGALDPFISLNGIEYQLSASALADPDYNAYMTAVIQASHDMQNQGDRFNLDASLYLSKYRKHSELDTIAGQVEVGPVLALDKYGLKGATLQLIGIASVVELSAVPYLYALGVGGVLTTVPGPGASMQTRFEYIWEAYQASVDRPDADQLSGPRARLTQTAQVQANDYFRLYGTAYGERKVGEVGYQSAWEAGISAGAKIAFGAGDDVPAASLDMQVGVTKRVYDESDGVTLPEARNDKSAYVQATLDIPLTAKTSILTIAGYRTQISNYEINTFDDASLTLALNTDF